MNNYDNTGRNDTLYQIALSIVYIAVAIISNYGAMYLVNAIFDTHFSFIQMACINTFLCIITRYRFIAIREID